MSRVGELVPRVLEQAGVAEQVERVKALADWEPRVGEGIAAVTGPLRLSGSTLVVGVRSSAWLMELNVMRREILARLNAGRSRGRIDKLVFVLAQDPGAGEERSGAAGAPGA
ncbi:MAG: DUF721 domain-containing protein [Gemmatimonadetes bacterium]|nr:DUF721 domain-containing protein [Gemmatimonadota bacterium]